MDEGHKKVKNMLQEIGSAEDFAVPFNMAAVARACDIWLHRRGLRSDYSIAFGDKAKRKANAQARQQPKG